MIRSYIFANKNIAPYVQSDSVKRTEGDYMKVTATVDLQRQTQASLHAIRKHNEHDPNVKHSNVQIFPEDSEMNSHYNLLNFDKTLNEIYGGMIDEKNKKLDEQFKTGKISFNRYNERKTDLKKWLDNNGKPKAAFTTWVVTFGNTESNLEILDNLGVKYELRKVKSEHGFIERPFVLDDDRQKWAKFWQTIYLSYARGFNRGDFGFKITAVDVHLDEGGAPHAHFESVNCGKTAKGKASYNLNSAIKKSLTGFNSKVSSDTRVNLQTFREVVDITLVQRVSKQAIIDHGVNLNLVMYRKKSKHKGLDMEEYKQRQASLAEIRRNQEIIDSQKSELKEIEEQVSRLKAENERLSVENQNMINNTKHVENTLKAILSDENIIPKEDEPVYYFDGLKPPVFLGSIREFIEMSKEKFYKYISKGNEQYKNIDHDNSIKEFTLVAVEHLEKWKKELRGYCENLHDKVLSGVGSVKALFINPSEFDLRVETILSDYVLHSSKKLENLRNFNPVQEGKNVATHYIQQERGKQIR